MKIIGDLLRALGYIKRSEIEKSSITSEPAQAPEEIIVINGVARPKKKFSDSPPKFVRKR